MLIFDLSWSCWFIDNLIRKTEWKLSKYLRLASLSKLFLGDISPLQGGSKVSGDSRVGRDSRRAEELRFGTVKIKSIMRNLHW